MKRKKRYAGGGEMIEVTAPRIPDSVDLSSFGPGGGMATYSLPGAREAMGPALPMAQAPMSPPPPAARAAATRPAPLPIARTAGYLGPTIRGEGGERVSMGMGRRGAIGAGASIPFKKGGKVKKMAKGGSTASKRADGCCTKGKTKGRFV